MAKRSTFIMLDRNIQEWRWYTKGNTFRVFIHLLINANIKPKGFEGIVIDRGQLATSHESISKSLNLSVQEVRTAMKHLKTTGEITITRHSNFQVVTVTNYNTYQANQQSYNNHLTINQQSYNNQSTIEQQQLNNNNNYNNIKNERMNTASPVHSPKKEKLSSSPEEQLKKIGGVGKDVVLLSDNQIDDLLDKISVDEFNKYVGVVAESELNGKRYTKKTHYQAILDMISNDRKVGL